MNTESHKNFLFEQLFPVNSTFPGEIEKLYKELLDLSSRRSRCWRKKTFLLYDLRYYEKKMRFIFELEKYGYTIERFFEEIGVDAEY